MDRRLRSDIVKSDDFIILVRNAGWDGATRYLAEDAAFGHGSVTSQVGHLLD